MKTLSIREYKILVSKAKDLHEKIKNGNATDADTLNLIQSIYNNFVKIFDTPKFLEVPRVTTLD